MEIKNMILEPEIANLLDEFLEKIKGKNIKEMVPILTEFQARLPKDRVFSDEEKNLILDTALSSMPEDEKNRFKMILKIAKAI